MKGRIAALTVSLLFIISLQAYGQEKKRPSAPSLTVPNTHSVVGYIEEVRGFVITLHGVDYELRGVPIKDASGNSTDMELFEVGANVELRFKKDKLSEAILIQSSKAEAR